MPTLPDPAARRARLVLNALPHVGPVTLHRMLSALGGDPARVLAASREELLRIHGVGPVIAATLTGWRQHFDPLAEEERLRREGTDFLVPGDPDYPGLLGETHDPPIGLYRRGPAALGRRWIALVGTRRPSFYGTTVARTFAAELTRAGFGVVSGLARGIDTAAHLGALEAGGATAAVLGCGLDLIYPPENRALQRRLEAEGSVLSEFPLGRRADRQSFAMRNRIISGMSEGVIVVESGAAGGAMITARFAGEQGRLLFAVPGRIDQPASAGCHQLIRDGATLLTKIDEVLEDVSYLAGMGPRPAAPEPAPVPGKVEVPVLGPDEERVHARLRDGARRSADELAAETGLAVARVSAALLGLELRQRAGRGVDGLYEVRGPG